MPFIPLSMVLFVVFCCCARIYVVLVLNQARNYEVQYIKPLLLLWVPFTALHSFYAASSNNRKLRAVINNDIDNVDTITSTAYYFILLLLLPLVDNVTIHSWSP